MVCHISLLKIPNPFTQTNFKKSEFKGIYEIKGKVTGMVMDAELYFPIQGKGIYYFDIFNGYPMKYQFQKENVDFWNYQEENLEDEVFLRPYYLDCLEKSINI